MPSKVADLFREVSNQKLTAGIYPKMWLGFASVVILMITVGFISQARLKQSMEDAAWVGHTERVLGQWIAVGWQLRTAEADARGFLLTGEKKFRDGFDEADRQTISHVALLRTLMADNTQQQKRVDRLLPLLQRVLNEERSAMVARRNTKQYYGAITNDGPATLQIRNLFQQIGAQETLLLRQRTTESRNGSVVARLIVALGSILGTVAVLLCCLLVTRHLRARAEAEATLLQAQQGLENRVEERTGELRRVAESLHAEIAERQRAEDQLRKSEQRYRMLFDASPLSMAVKDDETLQFLAANRAFLEMFGYTSDELVGMVPMDLVPAEAAASTAEFFSSVKDNESYSRALTAKHKSGKLMEIVVNASAIEFGDRKAHISLVSDITENKRLEAQLQQSQKMEAIGRLAGGVAHDFNNLLTVILGYCDLVLREVDEKDPVHGEVSEIQAAGQRAATLTNQLLAFSRKQILKPQVLEVNTVLANITPMIRRLLGEDIHISLHLDADTGRVQADPGQLEQALVNLCVNARDAMPNGGELLLETHNREVDEHLGAQRGITPGEYVVVSVSDTGCGMNDATKVKVFEPFFTTKEVGKGTGLGLSMVLGVVQQSGGTVTVYSELGVGTTFTIYLPRIEAPARPTEDPKHSETLTSGKGKTILLVEDETGVRTLASSVLRRAGYTVLEAATGREALQITATQQRAPELVLTDVVMPEMSGPELVDDLHRKWPGLPALYVSGYTDHVLLTRRALQEHSAFLQKPYSPETLLQRIVSVFSNSEGPPVLAVNEDAAIRQLSA